MSALLYPDKVFATAQAKTMLDTGGTLERIEDDRGHTVYVLTCNHITRQLQTLEEVGVWVDKLRDKQAPARALAELRVLWGDKLSNGTKTGP